MNTPGGHILIVDDNRFNRLLLTRALAEQGHTSVTAENGQQALEALASRTIDVVLLDVLMPEMDGYATLERIKQDPALRHIPVIMVSAVDEMDSVLRCIEMGATDYLPKPFNAALLRARINASLSVKRLRDLELEYLEQVGYVADAAAAVESNIFQDEQLNGVAGRSDALGRLARVFQRMAREVHAREQRLRRQLEQLQLDIEAREAAAAETALVYLPMDRRHALAAGYDLPDRTSGTVLFADISGFMPLTELLARELGYQLGVEELTRRLNQVYTVLIDAVHAERGSVINFSGDAITCWFDGDSGVRAIRCALAMQAGMRPFAIMMTPAGTQIALVLKVAVAAGGVRRFLVGDPQIQQIEVLAGSTLDHVAYGEHLALPGDVLADAESVQALGTHVLIHEWRTDAQYGERFAVVDAYTAAMPGSGWPTIPEHALTPTQARPWLLPAVYEKVRSGKSGSWPNFVRRRHSSCASAGSITTPMMRPGNTWIPSCAGCSRSWYVTTARSCN